MKGIIPTGEQENQLQNLFNRVLEFFPEVKDYKIKVRYEEDVSDDIIARIQIERGYKDIDAFESLKKATMIYKRGSISGLLIRFNTKLLLLDGAVRKDVIFETVSHELTHLLKESWRIKKFEEREDSHDEEFKRIHLEKFNKFRMSRNEVEIKNLDEFNQIVSIAFKQTEENITNKTFRGENLKTGTEKENE